MILEMISKETEKIFPESKSKALISIFFLRFLCPALCNHASKKPQKVRRAALVISKVMQVLVNRSQMEESDYDNKHVSLFNNFFEENIKKIENLSKILTNQNSFEEAKKKSEILIKIENENSSFFTKKVLLAELNTPTSSFEDSDSSLEIDDIFTPRNETISNSPKKKKAKANSLDMIFTSEKKNTLFSLKKYKSKKNFHHLKNTETPNTNKSLSLFIYDNVNALRDRLGTVFLSRNKTEEYIDIDKALFRLQRLQVSQKKVFSHFKKLEVLNKKKESKK